MLNWIIDFSLRNRRLVLVLGLLLIATGVASLSRISIDAFPDTTDVMVQINTTAPSLSPEEVEQQVTFRIEQAMGGLPNLKLLRSMSKFGLSQVTVVFEDGTDLYFARAQVLERLQRVELPEGLERPTMGPIATGLGEIYHYLVTAPGGDLTDSRILHDWVIKPQLLSVKGVAEVNTWGGFEKRFEVRVDPLLLAKYDMTFQEVIGALTDSNLNVGGGNIEAAGEILLVHGVGLTSTTEEIGGVVISAVDGRPVRVRDVARVVEGHAQRRGVVTAEGRGEAVLGLGFMLMGENSHEVADRLKRKMVEVQKTLPEGADIRVVYDRTELVDLVIGTVKKNLFEAMILVVAVLFLFMGHFRAALIVALAIPLSMLFAFNFMLRTGIAATLMSLGALDFGLLVDSSVIMVENSVRRLHEDESGAPVLRVVAEASKEVRKPTMFGEMIIILVYVPILALHGVEGKLFRPLALTVVFALVGSLALSLTLMPVLASYVLHRKHKHREPWTIRGLKRLYGPAVDWAIRHRTLVLGSVLIIVLGTVPIAMKLGAVFVPKLDEGSIVINTIRLPGVSVDESARFSTHIEKLLKAEFPHEIRSIWTRTGTPEVATDPMGIEVSDVFIMLSPRERWRRARTKDELEIQMRRALRALPGMNFAFTQPIEMRFNEMIAGIRTDVGVKIFGDDFETLRELQSEVAEVLAAVPGAAPGSVNSEPMVGQPVLQIRLDPEALSRYGIRAREVLGLVESIGGKEISEVRVRQMRFPMAVTLPEPYAKNPDLVETLLVTAPDGQRLPLSRLAKIARVSGPMVIHREWNRRRALVTCNVGSQDLAGFVAEARRRIEERIGPRLKQLGYPPVDFGGQFENLERAMETLSYVVPIALLIVLFLVYSTYGNVPDSLRVFTGVPFAAVGGVWALYLRDMPFSVSAGVGFIALSGISVLADMVMVSTIRQFVDEGIPLREAVLRAARQRLRPVLMTAITTGIGFVPMALNTGVGAEVQRPLATVVIGGVFTSTLLTLFVLPTLYAWIGRRGKEYR
ncbi:MAG: efflux RND transporter permease subunit [Planctomycetes bacterium]|nr:efflux RND transporter permease subunit [Planctomycetota bacterium]